MQRLGDQHREFKETTQAEQLPPMSACLCAPIGDFKPTAGGRWELPPSLKTCGCITTTEMDLRQQSFAPNQRQFTIQACALINDIEVLVPPEISVSKGGCAGCISNIEVKDRRPKELRHSWPTPRGVLRIGGCSCINTVKATVLEHGQPLPKNFFQWLAKKFWG